MQELIDSLSKGWRAQRSLSQMTLGKLINILQGLPQDKKIQNITDAHSYRGYYSDLSFSIKDGTQTVGELLDVLQIGCLNQVFTGYKGGDFTMDEHTPLWIAPYGMCGVKIMSITDGEVLSFVTEEDDL